jgi:hypothetical protein
MTNEPGVISEMEVSTIREWVESKPEPYLSACAVIAGLAAFLVEEENAKTAVRSLFVIANEIAEHAGTPVERDPGSAGKH